MDNGNNPQAQVRLHLDHRHIRKATDSKQLQPEKWQDSITFHFHIFGDRTMILARSMTRVI
jgi:hypothetical protein